MYYNPFETFTTILEFFTLFSLVVLIFILVKPSILKFMKHPNRKKGFFVWLSVYMIVYYIFAATPIGKKELAELKSKYPPKENYYYSKPDTNTVMYYVYPLKLLNKKDTTKK